MDYHEFSYIPYPSYHYSERTMNEKELEIRDLLRRTNNGDWFLKDRFQVQDRITVSKLFELKLKGIDAYEEIERNIRRSMSDKIVEYIHDNPGVIPMFYRIIEEDEEIYYTYSNLGPPRASMSPSEARDIHRIIVVVSFWASPCNLKYNARPSIL